MKRYIVFVQKLSDEGVRKVEAVASGWQVVHGPDRMTWAPVLPVAEIVAGWNREAMETCLRTPDSPLKWVHNWGAGVDGLPLREFRMRGVALTNSSGVHAFPISETVLAMMLSLTRKIHTYVRQQINHQWHHGGLSLEMHGKTVCVLGVGAIGGEIARLCKAFGMHTIGVRASREPHPYIDEMVGQEAKEAVLQALSRSDYVVNTLPLTNETHHVIGSHQFGAMKESSFYINIGRGATTDTAALVTALQSGAIAGAGLDVFDEEPLPATHPLWAMENVILTPHSSGSTAHYEERALDIFLTNLRAYIDQGAPSINVVDFDAQY